MNISDLWKYDLRKGNTDHPRNGACLFDAGMWLVYGRIGDNPPCACPIIRAYAIGLNDAMPDDLRSKLLTPFILRVVGNRDPQAEPARLHTIVLETARRVVPLASPLPEFQALQRLPDDAPLPEIQTAARVAAARVVEAEAWAAAAAVAAAARAAEAWAAVAAAVEAEAWAAAVVVAAAARAAEAARAGAWKEAVSVLDTALRIGKQSPEFDENEVRESVQAFAVAAGIEA